MIVFRPGLWRSKAGRIFILRRIYIDGVLGTPFCVKSFRYLG